MQEFISICASMSGADLHRETLHASRKQSTCQWELAACMIAVDRVKAWMNVGCSNIYEYADRHLGLGGGKVHQLLRVGRALEGLSYLSGAVREGRVSWCKAREITRVATPQDDEAWVEFATKSTTREVEQRVSRRPRSRESVAMGHRPAPTSAVALVPAAPVPATSVPPAPASAITAGAASAVGSVSEDSLSEPTMLFGPEPNETTSGKAESAPLPPPLVRLVASLDAESYALFEAARNMLTQRLGRPLSLEQVLTEMASLVLVSGDARSRARHAVIVHVDAVGQATFQTDRGDLPAEPRQLRSTSSEERANARLEAASAISAPRNASEGRAKTKKRGATKRRKLPISVIREKLRGVGHRCERCRRRGLLELDHIQPLNAAGTDDPDNLRVLCRPCHALRHRQEWSIEGLSDRPERERAGAT